MKIYIVYSCDEWGSSVNPIYVGTSVKKLKSFVAKEIKAQNMEYASEYEDRTLTPRQQSDLFKREFDKNLEYNTLNIRLTYGIIEAYDNNSEI